MSYNERIVPEQFGFKNTERNQQLVNVLLRGVNTYVYNGTQDVLAIAHSFTRNGIVDICTVPLQKNKPRHN